MHTIDKIDFYAIYQHMRNNKLILFGAGQGFLDTVEILCKIDKSLLSQIDYIVDNNRVGNSINLFRRIISVYSPEYLKKNWKKEQIIIISTQYYEEICTQLDQYEELNDAVVLFYEYIETSRLMSEFWLPDSLKISDKSLIPKIIHYCWFGRNPIPERYKEWMSTWKKYCPDYEIVEWNEDNYDYKKNEYMYEAYKAGKWGFVPDYARLDIIYNHGGIYLDTDVELVQNLDNLLYQKAFAGLQGDLRVANGLGFGAIPHLNNIRKQMMVYNNKHFISKDGQMDLTPAPTMQTEVMLECGYKKINKYQVVDDVTILPAPVLGGIIGSSVIVDERVYAIHHYDGSWTTEDMRQRQKIYKNRLHANLNNFYKKIDRC